MSLTPWHRSKKRLFCDPCWRKARPRARPGISPSQRASVPPGPCVYCGAPDAETIDHIVPLAQAGAHDVGNFVRACKRCNSSKGTLTPEEWLASGRAPRQWTLFAKFADDVKAEAS